MKNLFTNTQNSEPIIDLTDVPEEKWCKNYIGQGYRNIHYCINSDYQGQIILFGYDINNTPTTFILPHQSWVKYSVNYIPNGNVKEYDIYDNRLETKYFKNVSARKKFIESISDSVTIAEALRPEQECLLKLFYKNNFETDFNIQPLRQFFLDIETEISETFCRASAATNRINLITIYDSKTNTYYSWSLENKCTVIPDESKTTLNSVKYKLYCFGNNEANLLEAFIDFWENNFPDVVIGYNSKNFDMPYLVHRIEQVLSKHAASRLSPVHSYRIKEIPSTTQILDTPDIEVDIHGIFLADELVLYRDKFMVNPNLDGGYSLSNVGEAEGLGRKLEYTGSLKDLYLKDYQTFYEYNVRDVELLKNIENKCDLLSLLRKITSLGLCPMQSIYTSISYLMGCVISFTRKKVDMDDKEKQIIFNSYVNKTPDNTGGYEGAFVFPPVVGVYKKGIATVDVNSLYPSTIRSLNLSPETYVGKLLENWDERDEKDLSVVHLQFANSSNVKEIPRNVFDQLLDEKFIISKNNTIFLKHKIKRGILADWCTDFYAMRKKFKKAMGEKQHLLNISKSESEEHKKQLETEILRLNNSQRGVKTMLNSIYGIMGAPHSAIYNIDIVQSVTRNGKFFNTNASKTMFKMFKQLFNIDDDYVVTISGDTDSCSKDTKVDVLFTDDYAVVR